MTIDHQGVYNAAEQHLTRAHGGPISPRFIVMHYTAGWTAESALSTFCHTGAKVSAHFVISREGDVYQCVPCNEAAWHAGPSLHNGVRSLNNHAVGIEFVNIGYVTPTDDGKAIVDPYGHIRQVLSLPGEHAGHSTFVHAAHPRLGSGIKWWPTYTLKQLEAADILVAALIDRYKIEDIVSHEQIDTRGWKTDPGPAFPMDRYRVLLREGEMEHHPRLVVKANPSLNVRGGPGTGFEVIDKLMAGDQVWLLAREGDWCLVRLRGDVDEGWVHGNYLIPA